MNTLLGLAGQGARCELAGIGGLAAIHNYVTRRIVPGELIHRWFGEAAAEPLLRPA